MFWKLFLSTGGQCVLRKRLANFEEEEFPISELNIETKGAECGDLLIDKTLKIFKPTVLILRDCSCCPE